jgi:hypothetical protein
VSIMWNQAFLGQVRLVRHPYPNFRLGQSTAEGCELLGFQVQPFLTADPELQARVEQAKASGLQVVEVPSSRSRTSLSPPGSIVTADMVPGTELWACPPTWRSPYPRLEPPGAPEGPPGPRPSIPGGPGDPPSEPSAKEFPIVPVVGGLAAAGLLAYLIFG